MALPVEKTLPAHTKKKPVFLQEIQVLSICTVNDCNSDKLI
jgi:hypothetical protein